MEEEKTVLVHFTTPLEEYQFTLADAIAIPVRLKRLGLSKVINHLLNRSDDPVPFDFLIEDKFIRVSLKKFLKENEVTQEGVIEIEYILAVEDPETLPGIEHDDWVSATDKRQSAQKHGFIVSGCYDNVIRFWEKGSVGTDAEPVLSIKEHEKAITGISSCSNEDGLLYCSSSQDETVRVWNVDLEKKSYECHSILVGNTTAVEDCDMDSTGNLVIAGAWDGSIRLWSLVDAVDEVQQEEGSTKKRRVIHDTDRRSPALVLEGHTQSAASLQFIDDIELVSGSWDMSLKFWDLERAGTNTVSLTGFKPIISLDYNTESGLVITGHGDRGIRLWDRRAQSDEVSQMFKSHKNWVKAVCWHPSQPNTFISASYDKSIKLWDVRSTTPMTTISEPHSDKILTATWADNNTIVSGSADKLLKLHKIK